MYAIRSYYGVSAVPVAPHPSPELVELGEAEPVRLADEDRVRVGDVQPRLDDGGAKQQVGAPAGEIVHGERKLLLVHLPVGHEDPDVGEDLPQEALHGRQGLHAVVHEKHLAPPADLPVHRLADDLFV